MKIVLLIIEIRKFDVQRPKSIDLEQDSKFEVIDLKDEVVSTTLVAYNQKDVITTEMVPTTPENTFISLQNHILSIKNVIVNSILPITMMIPFLSVSNLLWLLVMLLLPIIKKNSESGWFFV